jgi:hypothetical protein
MIRPKTILCDIDGVIFEHCGDITKQHLIEPTVLPGVKDVWRDWDINGYKIILVTGRRESVRKETEEQLSKSGIFYDNLIMGVTGGERVLINDKKQNCENDTAISVNLKRNDGMKNVKL